MAAITSVRLKVGMEVHVELSTRTKMFTRVGNPAHPDFEDASPNTLIDPVVLGLPGALPVLNKEAIDRSILVGLALSCSIARFTKWDRKSYFYPDLPKNYQISQYDLPLCFDGSFDFQIEDESGQPTDQIKRVGIIRAHLEEDAGKLLHEAPGGSPINHSIVDLNRAGTPLLEIVTAPDFDSADEVVSFARTLRSICRFVGATEGVMQKGHMRFEPNINCILTLDDGREVATPIVEVKNLNSFKSLRGAIEYERREQPKRFLLDGRTLGRGTKSTRGWDDTRAETFLQREKEDADDYRYFPDPDLTPVRITDQWLDAIRQRLPELPAARSARYQESFALTRKEAAALVEERAICQFFESSLQIAADELAADSNLNRTELHSRAGKLAANLILQSGFKRANELGISVDAMGITPAQLAGIIKLRERGTISAAAADALFGLLCTSDESADALAAQHGLAQVRDDASLAAWCDQAIAAHPKAAEDVRAGKMQAIGRLVGEVMKLSGGKAEAAAVREMLLSRLGQS